MNSNQCPICEKVLSKSGSRFQLLRHMKSVHEIDKPEGMLKMSTGPEIKERVKVGGQKQKGPNLKTTPRKRNPQLIQKRRKAERPVVALHITALDARNELISKGSMKIKGKEKGVDRSADGPRKQTRPQLFVPKFKSINQKEAEFASKILVKTQEVRRVIVEKNTMEVTEVQTEMIWDRALKEMEYFIRITCTLHQLKSAKELYEIGRTDCPHLERDVLKVIITTHFPMGQNLEMETKNQRKRKFV